LERLRKLDLHAKLQAELDAGLLSSKKVFPASVERVNGDLKGDEASRVLKEVEKVFPVPDAISDGMVGLAVR